MNGNLSKISGHRRGALMLMLFVVIVVGSIIALRLLPENDVIVRRDTEDYLHNNLSQIREAFDMKWQADPAWNPDLSNKAGIKVALTTLTTENYLRDKDVKDPTIPNYLWDSSDDYFWKASANFASNNSFEEDPATIVNWTAAPGTTAVTDVQYLSGTELDDYPHQNKLGLPLQSGGNSLMITK